MRPPHRSIAVALVAPMLALAVSAYGFVGLRCRVTGMVSIATCCPQPDGEKVPEQSSVADPGCCERLVIVNAKPAAARAAEAQHAVAHLPAIAPRRVETPTLVGFQRFAPNGDPPDVFRPPLRLLHRSLLI